MKFYTTTNERPELAAELVHTFLGAAFNGEERHRCRLLKIKALEDRTALGAEAGPLKK